MSLSLDTETLQELQGQSSFHGGKVTVQESLGMYGIRAGGRTARWIPSFSKNDQALRSAILHAAITYIFRSKLVPESFVIDLKNIDRLARDKAASLKAIADGSENDYWDRTGNYLEAIDRVGYLGILSAVCWRAWRCMPAWHDKDIAISLAMQPGTVKGILQRVRRVAVLLGYECCPPRKDRRQPKVTDDAIIDLWNAGLTVDRIVAEAHVSPTRVRTLLRRCGLFVWRKRQKGFASVEQIIADWNTGCTVKQITAKHSVGRLRVVTILKARGIHKKRMKGVTSSSDAEVSLAVRVPING